ncbi:DUF21 domain-containing protein [Exilibacterium tricleocarpae]|uniref:DUF21 domain-containing protein n=1 Tax=Exilibacterium tricleocarpae TaxID=2591008 RepID=A0A545U6Q5_9GAMM|nr:DUF21 domain-containing protein [Exilibacterium tricleocarpae]TQV85158.1 DUF21 domain-containing protein [Exilibacterium tricleocarpae]
MLQELTWIGIAFCVSQSALFSGLNLAFFSLSRMQLQVDSDRGMRAADRVLALRKDSNFLLTTILWGNVAINVLLTLLSNSVMAGATAFLFSTVVITFFGEITPQAYFSRNALRMASLLAPVLRFYQFLLYPVAKPSAKVLDAWLGREGIDYLRENDLKAVIRAHIEAEDAEVQPVEGIGAINFLAIDDLSVSDEGEVVNEQSVIPLPAKVDFPLIPEIERSPDDPFLQRLDASGQSWVILTNDAGEPLLVVDADGCLRDAVFNREQPFDPYDYCHRPIVVTDPKVPLGDLIYQLKINERDDRNHDGVIEDDVILLWGEQRRIITGADLLGRLLKGITS